MKVHERRAGVSRWGRRILSSLAAFLCLAGLGATVEGCGLSALVAGAVVSSSGGSSSGSGGVPAPQVDSVTPTAASHMGGTVVTLSGANFPTGETPNVTVGGVAATEVKVLSSTTLTLTLPATTTVGPVDIVVSGARGGSGTLSQTFTFTNAPPSATIEPLATTQTLNLVFGVTLRDAESDRIDILLEYSTGGAFLPIPPAQILSGGTQGLASSPSGVTHNLTWDTSGLFSAQNANQVRIRATPTDTSDGLVAPAAESNAFSIVNNLPPTLDVAAPANDSFEVAVSFTLADPNPGATLTVTGATWRDANSGATGSVTIKSGTPAALPSVVASAVSATTHTFVWDSFKDLGFGNNRLVELTLTVSDGTQTVSATSGTFFVSNGPLTDSDVNAASLIQLKGFAIGDLNGDGRKDAFATTDVLLGTSLLISSGQTFQSPQTQDLLGLPLPFATAAIGWSGTTTLSAPFGTSTLAVGDWLSLPYSFGGQFGDPIGPRSFRIAALGATTITIEDPDNYAASDLLPGSATLGGAVAPAFALTRRQAGRAGLSAANLPNDFRPGEVAILSVDEDLSTTASPTSDVVIANAAPAQLVTAATAVAGAVFTVNDLTPIPFSSQTYEAGMRVLLQQGATTEQATIQSINAGTSQITLRAAPAATFTPGTLVLSLTSSSWPLINQAGHQKNHGLVVIPQIGGALGVPTQVIATGARFTNDLIAADVAGPAGGPDGILDLVAICGATSNPSSTQGAASILIRRSTGTFFNAPIVVNTGTGGATAAGSVHGTVADVTSDGLPDIVVANRGESSISIIVQNPASPGSFLPAQNISLSSFGIPNGDVQAVAVADFNQDGFPDLAVGGALTQRILLFRGADPDGAGPAVSFPGGNAAAPTLLATQSPAPPAVVAGSPSSQPASFLFVGVSPARFQTGDLNGDGRPDLVVVENVQNRLTAFMNLGTSGATTAFSAVRLTTSLGPVDLEIQDVSGDGRVDICVAGSLLGDISRFQALVPGTLDRFVSFPVGVSPQGVLAADLTPDFPGPELISINNGDSSVTILARDGAGGLRPLGPSPGVRDVLVEAQDKATLSPTPSTGSLRLLAANAGDVADFNGDGRLDLVVFSQSSTDGVAGAAVLLNEGGVAPIRTTTRVLLARGNGLNGTVAQIVSDSNPDIVFTEFLSTTSGAFNVFRGLGNANFAQSSQFTLALPSGVIKADIDGDTDIDLIAPLNAAVPANFQVLLQNPAGTLAAPSDGVTGGITGFTGTSFAAVGDFNNDGLQDIAVTNFLSSRLAVAFQNNPAVSPPKFDRVVEVLCLLQPASVNVGDLNGDGLDDLVAVFSGDNQVGVYYQRAGVNKQPAQSLEGPILLPTGPSPFGATIVDVNGDGRVDLAVTSRGANTIDVFFQR